MKFAISKMRRDDPRVNEFICDMGHENTIGPSAVGMIIENIVTESVVAVGVFDPWKSHFEFQCISQLAAMDKTPELISMLVCRWRHIRAKRDQMARSN